MNHMQKATSDFFYDALSFNMKLVYFLFPF